MLDVGDRTIRTIVFVLHEEIVNQYLGMAFYGGVSIEGEVSVQAISYEVVAPFIVRATLDLARRWRIMGFSCYSISHVVLFCYPSVFWTLREDIMVSKIKIVRSLCMIVSTG